MRRVELAPTIGSTSAVGFGCASLGSRIGTKAGVKALERAYEAGIRWYDVAPSYGDGQAEEILGRFNRDKGDALNICTKVGIWPAPRPLALRVIKPLVRGLVNALPTVRKHVSRARPAPSSTPLTGEAIAASVDASLRRLNRDYLDVLALHDATAEDVQREEILRALDDLLRGGKVRALAIASSLEAGLVGVTTSSVYSILQIPNNPYERSLKEAVARLPGERRIGFVTHSAYGAFSALEQSRERLRRDKRALATFLAAGYDGPPSEVAAAFLADYALATNRNGVTLFSMLKPEHLDFNIRRLNKLPEAESLEQLARHLR